MSVLKELSEIFGILFPAQQEKCTFVIYAYKDKPYFTSMELGKFWNPNFTSSSQVILNFATMEMRQICKAAENGCTEFELYACKKSIVSI